MSNPKVFQFKITLNDSTPRVWRRIVVPSDYTFFALHCALQNAMGWADSHLHAFYITPQKGNERITIEFPNPEGDDFGRTGEIQDERQARIADYFDKTVKQCLYCYDFGDNWDHTILFERELPRDPQTMYPRCIAGENVCPPDNCGGVGGYDRLQNILKSPNDPEYTDMLEWLGMDDPSEFDPHEFSTADVAFDSPRQRLAEWNKGFGLR